ncbi:MAG: hypothetical protein ACM3UZ_03385 [Acidobacteriota bacterium]
MQSEIKLVFHKKALRSYIEVDLCRDCPRQDDKGCCGYYSPVFYPTDLAYIARKKPELINYITDLPRLTVLDASITVNSVPEGPNAFHCQFHTRDKGCLLDMELRESVCRHFVCPGIGWWQEPELELWKNYFDEIADFEIDLNNQLATRLKSEGLSLRSRSDWDTIIKNLLSWIDFGLYESAKLGKDLPLTESFSIKRDLLFGSDWIL